MDDVLDAINGVAAIVDSNVPLTVLALGDCAVVPDEVVEPVEAEVSVELVDGLVGNKLVTGNPLKIDETDIATAVAKRSRPTTGIIRAR